MVSGIAMFLSSLMVRRLRVNWWLARCVLFGVLVDVETASAISFVDQAAEAGVALGDMTLERSVERRMDEHGVPGAGRCERTSEERE